MISKLPIGIDNFEEIRMEGFYYVDKTGMIKELLDSWGKVNLFTRPRRFGKTLNMSMLQCFFEYGHDSSLFDGLKISEEKELCEKYMGKFPVIFITLKGVSGRNFENALGMLRNINTYRLANVFDREYKLFLIYCFGIYFISCALHFFLLQAIPYFRIWLIPSE